MLFFELAAITLQRAIELGVSVTTCNDWSGLSVLPLVMNGAGYQCYHLEPGTKKKFSLYLIFAILSLYTLSSMFSNVEAGIVLIQNRNVDKVLKAPKARVNKYI